VEKENILTVAKGEGWVKEKIQGGGCGQKRVGSTWGGTLVSELLCILST